MSSQPKVFISYAWESSAHKSWVKKLAEKIQKNGIEVILDQWSLKPGDHLTEFMERSIAECDLTLVICSPSYKTKSDTRTAGVGYETKISSSIILRHKSNKFIPILRGGSSNDCIPLWLDGILYIDFNEGSYNAISFKALLQRLFNVNLTPDIGEKPGWIIDFSTRLRDYFMLGIRVGYRLVYLGNNAKRSVGDLLESLKDLGIDNETLHIELKKGIDQEGWKTNHDRISKFMDAVLMVTNEVMVSADEDEWNWYTLGLYLGEFRNSTQLSDDDSGQQFLETNKNNIALVLEELTIPKSLKVPLSTLKTNLTKKRSDTQLILNNAIELIDHVRKFSRGQ